MLVLLAFGVAVGECVILVASVAVLLVGHVHDAVCAVEYGICIAVLAQCLVPYHVFALAAVEQIAELASSCLLGHILVTVAVGRACHRTHSQVALIGAPAVGQIRLVSLTADTAVLLVTCRQDNVAAAIYIRDIACHSLAREHAYADAGVGGDVGIHEAYVLHCGAVHAAEETQFVGIVLRHGQIGNLMALAVECAAVRKLRISSSVAVAADGGEVLHTAHVDVGCQFGIGTRVAQVYEG